MNETAQAPPPADRFSLRSGSPLAACSRRRRRERAAAEGRGDRRPVHADRPGRPPGQRHAISPANTGSSISASPIARTSARPTCSQIGQGLRRFEKSDPARAARGPADLHQRRSGARHAGGAQAVCRRLPSAPDRPDRHRRSRSPRSRRASASIMPRSSGAGASGYPVNHSRHRLPVRAQRRADRHAAVRTRAPRRSPPSSSDG